MGGGVIRGRLSYRFVGGDAHIAPLYIGNAIDRMSVGEGLCPALPVIPNQ